MARLPPIRRLSAEDFKDQSAWIDKLLVPLNDYMERTTSALNRGLTLNENFAGELRTIDIDGTFPIKLAWNLSARPKAVWIGAIERTNGAAYSQTTAIQVQWQFNQAGQLQIDGVVGTLSPSPAAATKYRITLVCVTG